jgi:hypothetical protein
LIRGLLALCLLLPVSTYAAQPDFPVPPIPPDVPPPMSAPVPNPDIILPDDGQTHSAVTLDMNIHRRSEPDPSRGFAPGSHYDVDQDHRSSSFTRDLPGVLFHIPLP